MTSAVKDEPLTVEKDELLTVEAAVPLFPVPPSEESIYRWIRDGHLRATRVGGRVYVTPDAVAEFLVRGLGNV